MRSISLLIRQARFWAPIGALLVVAGLGLLACISPPLDSPSPSQGRVRPIFIPQNVRNKVDLLVMVDNSNSMDAMQLELKNRFAQFFKPFQDLADRPNDATFADLNIGVVTSDFGAGASGAPGCTPSGLQGGGDQGKLQAIGKKADPSCVKPVGTNFIHYVFGPNGTTAKSNLPGAQSLITTFTCMASIGATGCGFEHQLEAVYAALHNPIPENMGNADNPGFLREDAILVVVFLTNEDDASAPPDSDIFNKNLVAQYGYEDSYSRQTRFAVQCGSPPMFPPYADSNGDISPCIPAPGAVGKQYDVARYIDFFTQPFQSGGVKTNPLDVVLIGIDAPETPFQVILSNPGTAAGMPYLPCGTLNEQSNPPCVPVLQHSCVNQANPGLFGDPSVRLNTVIHAVPQNQITSICAESYQEALTNAAKLVVSNLGGGCIPDRFPVDPMTCKPVFDCNVQDETIDINGQKMDTQLPRCDPFEAAADPNMPSVQHSVVPCWVIAPKDICAATGDGVGLTIDRGIDPSSGHPNEAPPHTTAIVTCATIAGSADGGSTCGK